MSKIETGVRFHLSHGTVAYSVLVRCDAKPSAVAEREWSDRIYQVVRQLSAAGSVTDERAILQGLRTVGLDCVSVTVMPSIAINYHAELLP